MNVWSKPSTVYWSPLIVDSQTLGDSIDDLDMLVDTASSLYKVSSIRLSLCHSRLCLTLVLAENMFLLWGSPVFALWLSIIRISVSHSGYADGNSTLGSMYEVLQNNQVAFYDACWRSLATILTMLQIVDCKS